MRRLMVKFKLTLIAAIILFSYNLQSLKEKKKEPATAAVAPKKRGKKRS
jgi:hypothetical protein